MTPRPAARRPAARRSRACRGAVRQCAGRQARRVGLAVAACLIAAWPRVAAAQASRLVATVDSSNRADREGDVLARRVTIRITDTPLVLALSQIAREGNLRLSYSSDVVPMLRRVTLSAAGVPVGDVLREALEGTNIEAVSTPSGYVVLVRSPTAANATTAPVPGTVPSGHPRRPSTTCSSARP